MEHLIYSLRQASDLSDHLSDGGRYQIDSRSSGLDIALANHQDTLVKRWVGWMDRVQGGEQPLVGCFFDAKIRRFVCYRILRDQNGASEAHVVIQTREEAAANGSIFRRMQDMEFGDEPEMEKPEADQELQAMECVLRDHGDLLSKLIAAMLADDPLSVNAFRRIYICDTAEKGEAWLNAVITLCCGTGWMRWLLATCDSDDLPEKMLAADYGHRGGVFIGPDSREGRAVGEGECILDAGNHTYCGTRGSEELEHSVGRLIERLIGNEWGLKLIYQMKERMLNQEASGNHADMFALLRLLCGDKELRGEQADRACGLLEQGRVAADSGDDCDFTLMKAVLQHPGLSARTMFRYLKVLYGRLDDTERMTVMRQLAERMIDAAVGENSDDLEEYLRLMNGLKEDAVNRLSLWLVHDSALSRMTACLKRFAPEMLGMLLVILIDSLDNVCGTTLEDMFTMQKLKKLLVDMTDLLLEADEEALIKALGGCAAAQDVLICYAMLYYWNHERDDRQTGIVWKAVLHAVLKMPKEAQFAAFRMFCKQEIDCALGAAEEILAAGSRSGLMGSAEIASLFMELLGAAQGRQVGGRLLGEAVKRFGSEDEQVSRELLNGIADHLRQGQSTDEDRILRLIMDAAQHHAQLYIEDGSEERRVFGIYRWMGEQNLTDKHGAFSGERLSAMRQKKASLAENVRLLRVVMAYCHAAPCVHLAQHAEVKRLASEVFARLIDFGWQADTDIRQLFSADEMTAVLADYTEAMQAPEKERMGERVYRVVHQIMNPSETLQVIFKLTLGGERQIMLADRLLFCMACRKEHSVREMDGLCYETWHNLQVRRMEIEFGSDYVGVRCTDAQDLIRQHRQQLGEIAELIGASCRRDKMRLLKDVFVLWMDIMPLDTVDACMRTAHVMRKVGFCQRSERSDANWRFKLMEKLLNAEKPNRWPAALEALKELDVLPVRMGDRRNISMLEGMLCNISRKLGEKTEHGTLIESGFMTCGKDSERNVSDIEPVRLYAKAVFDVSARQDNGWEKDQLNMLCSLIDYAVSSGRYAERVAMELKRSIRMELDEEFIRNIRNEVRKNGRFFPKSRWSKEQTAVINQWFE